MRCRRTKPSTISWRARSRGASSPSAGRRRSPRSPRSESCCCASRSSGSAARGLASATRALQMTVARSLVASALTKARANDLAAWEDLHVVWKLARALDGHPQMMAQTAALSMARMINAVAWKMPLPAPAWFGELQARDNVRPLLEAFQYQAASYWEDGARIFPTKWLATSVEHDRLIAEELLSATGCDVNARANELGTDLTFVW